MDTPVADAQLADLPVELILQIFYFCDLQSLGRLSQTCRHFRRISNDEILWRKIYSKTLLPVVGPSLSSSPRERISSIWKSLPAKQQFHLLQNFKKDKSTSRAPATRLHQLTSGLNHTDKLRLCMQKVCVDDRGMWTANVDTVFRVPWHTKSTGQHLTADVKHVQRYKRSSEPADHVGDFAVSDKLLASGHWNGAVAFGGIDDSHQTWVQPHLSDVHSVVLKGGLLASGSRDFTLSVYDTDTVEQVCFVNFQERIWCLAAHEHVPLLAVGTSGTSKTPYAQLIPPAGEKAAPLQVLEPGNLRLFDLERRVVVNSLCQTFKHGFGILALQYMNAQMLVSGGHDGLLSCWDLRQNRCVQQLDSDADIAIYCFAMDGKSTILTGHANYNTVCFWDTRYGRYPISTKFYEQDCGEATASCSVYGLAFTPFEVHVGLADGVYRAPFCS